MTNRSRLPEDAVVEIARGLFCNRGMRWDQFRDLALTMATRIRAELVDGDTIRQLTVEDRLKPARKLYAELKNLAGDTNDARNEAAYEERLKGFVACLVSVQKAMHADDCPVGKHCEDPFCHHDGVCTCVVVNGGAVGEPIAILTELRETILASARNLPNGCSYSEGPFRGASMYNVATKVIEGIDKSIEAIKSANSEAAS